MFLIETSGERPGSVFPVEGERVTIGRSSECTIVLADHTVSKAHAAVEPEGGRIVIRDLGSRNGTYVNGERVVEWWLREGDKIRIGGTRFRVTSEATPATRHPSGRSPADTGEESAVGAGEVDRLWALLRAGRTIEDPIELLACLLNHLIEMLGADRGSVVLLEEDGKNPALRVDGERDPGGGGDLLSLDAAACRRAVEERATVVSEAAAAPAPDAAARHILAAPIRTRRKLVGIAWLDRPPERPPFGLADVKLADLATGLVAQAIVEAIAGGSA